MQLRPAQSAETCPKIREGKVRLSFSLSYLRMDTNGNVRSERYCLAHDASIIGLAESDWKVAGKKCAIGLIRKYDIP